MLRVGALRALAVARVGVVGPTRATPVGCDDQATSPTSVEVNRAPWADLDARTPIGRDRPSTGSNPGLRRPRSTGPTRQVVRIRSEPGLVGVEPATQGAAEAQAHADPDQRERHDSQ